jgi:ABC-2 type transport system permease protein
MIAPTVLGLEQRQLRHRGAWWWVAVFLVLTGMGVVNGLSAVARAGVTADQQAVDITLPHTPLQAISIGHTGLLPDRATPFTEYDVTTMWPTQLLPRAATVQDLYTTTVGQFDLAHALVWLLPLLVIVLSYDLLSREREEGTLALVLSQPITARQVVAAKTVARVPWIVLPALTIYAAAIAPRLPEMTTRTSVLAGAGGLLVAAYALMWLALCVWVNTRQWSSPANGLILGVCWLMLVLVLPPGIDGVVRARHGRPTTAEVELSDGYWRRGAAYGSPGHEAYYQRLLVEHPALGPARPANPDPVRMRSYGEDGGRALSYYYYAYQDLAGAAENLAQRFADRQRLLDHLRYVSPAAALKESLDEVAGTHERRYRSFERQVRAHFDALRSSAWRREFKVQSLSSLASVQREARAALDREDGPHDRPPSFQCDEDPISIVAGRLNAAALGLLLPAVMCSVAAARRLRRQCVVN